MNTRSRSDLILVGLGTLLVAQVALMGYRAVRPPIGEQERLAVGDVIGELATTRADGRAARLVGQPAEPTLLMVFHSECAWCREVAPAWSEWLADAPEGLKILGVSSEPVDVAAAYAAEVEWQMQVASVTIRQPGDLAHSLTSRTPWLFLLDERGQIRFEAQGSHLDDLDAALGRVEAAPAAGDDQ